MNTEKIEIPTSKRNLILIIAAAFLMIFLGAWLLLDGAGQQNRYPPIFVKVAGATGVVLFGVLGGVSIKKIYDSRPGLTIDQDGIIDNTHVNSVGFVPWEHIESISMAKLMSNKFLVIHLACPEVYIGNARNKVAANIMKSNNKTYGSPITITPTTLTLKYDELEKLVVSAFEKYKNS